MHYIVVGLCCGIYRWGTIAFFISSCFGLSVIVFFNDLPEMNVVGCLGTGRDLSLNIPQQRRVRSRIEVTLGGIAAFSHCQDSSISSSNRSLARRGCLCNLSKANQQNWIGKMVDINTNPQCGAKSCIANAAVNPQRKNKNPAASIPIALSALRKSSLGKICTKMLATMTISKEIYVVQS